jgi:predicted ATP-binding protein involved in virulence
MTFASMTLLGWRQFDYVSLNFHSRLTVITGVNGSGKTALLRVLARHFSWWYEELGIPVLDPKLGGVRILTSLLQNT